MNKYIYENYKCYCNRFSNCAECKVYRGVLFENDLGCWWFIYDQNDKLPMITYEYEYEDD